MKLHAAVRADLREVAGGKVGRRVVLKMVKNQLAAASQAEFEFLEGEGFSAELELLELGLRHGVLDRVGGEIRFEGEESGLEELREDVDLCVRVNSAIRAEMGLPQRKPVGRSMGMAGAARRASGD